MQGRMRLAGNDRHRRALVVADGVSLAAGGRELLHEIDLVVAAGEIVTIIGPNGAGKTTLIRVLLGLLTPTAGSVWRRPAIRVGYLPQKLSIDPVLPLTVSRMMTLTVRRARHVVQAALAETGVGHLADQQVDALSGGELRRVLLARCLLRDPDLLVLDEPIQGVDFAGETALYDLIGGLRDQQGCGVVMVSHDLHVVMAATDRVICINRHVCCEGAPEHVSSHPEYVRLFGAQAARAVAVYTHHHNHDHHDREG